MRRKPSRRKIGRPKTRLGLPDLDQSKAAVIGSLRSPESQRGYRHAIDEFIEWYCSEPRLSFNRTVVLRSESIWNPAIWHQAQLMFDSLR
jgi:hypothetical protein